MVTYKMISRVIGAAMIAATAVCADVVVAEAQEKRAETPLGSWPDNEPAGMTRILAIDGSSKDWPGLGQGGGWKDNNRVRAVSDPSSKYGQSIEKRFLAGDQSGWHGNIYRGDFGAYDELYFRLVFRFSHNWQYHTGMNKMFYWGSTGRPWPQGPTQFYVGIRGGVFEFVNQSASGEAYSRGNFKANAPLISLDEYHTIEVLHVANTPGKSDGSARMWIDGVEVNSFNQLGRPNRTHVQLENLRWLNYDDPRLTGLQAFMFWGGIGDTKRVNDWIRLSELYVSGKN